MSRPDRWKVLVVAGLLLASAGAGVAVYQDDAPAETAAASQPADETADEPGSAGDPGLAADADAAPLSPSDVEGPVYEEYTGSFDAAPATGSLDLRIDHGPVRVVGWDKAGYNVMVLQENATDSQASDYETKVEFDDQSSQDHLDLSLVVDRDGTYAVNVETAAGSTGDGDHAHPAIVAFVPSATSYEDVTACSGQEHMFEQTWEDTWGSVPWPWADDDDVHVDPDCVGPDDSPGFHVNSDLTYQDDDEEEKTGYGFTTGASGIEGSTLRVATGHGDAALQDVDFANMEVLSGHGDLVAQGLVSGNATLLTAHGDVKVQEARGADLAVTTEHGDIAAGVTPTASGTLDLTSEHGNVQALVAPADGRAYDVSTGTDHGEMTLAVANATVERTEHGENESWRDPSYWTGIFEERDGYEETATARTGNWDAAPIQATVLAGTDHGDVLVTDGQASVTWDLSDDEDR